TITDRECDSRLRRLMCGRPLAFRRTPLLRFLTWGRLSLAQVQDNGKSVPGKAETFRTSDGRAASLAFAMRRFELGDIRGLKNSAGHLCPWALANARASDTLCIGARISTFNGNHVFVLCGRLGGYGRHQ